MSTATRIFWMLLCLSRIFLSLHEQEGSVSQLPWHILKGDWQGRFLLLEGIVGTDGTEGETYQHLIEGRKNGSDTTEMGQINQPDQIAPLSEPGGTQRVQSDQELELTSKSRSKSKWNLSPFAFNWEIKIPDEKFLN